MNPPLAVVCCSGGMDSLASAALARRSHRLALLHATYGQRTATRERRAFDDIAAHYNVPPTLRLAVDLGHLARIGASSLTDPSMEVEQPGEGNSELDAIGRGAEGSAIPSTYVPFRNANIISAAASWAEALGARSVWLGVTDEDSAGYPDCRRAFIDAMQRAVDLGTRPETAIAIETPLIDKTKADIVRIGLELGAPFALSWSCYTAQERACGRCDSCRRRLRAFASAGAADPIAYAEGASP